MRLSLLIQKAADAARSKSIKRAGDRWGRWWNQSGWSHQRGMATRAGTWIHRVWEGLNLPFTVSVMRRTCL
jgi:hypothetical protein